MPTPTNLRETPTESAPALPHEIWCQPTMDAQTGKPRDEVRIESFPHMADQPKGRAIPSHIVTRCVECGATAYREIGH